ncbi:hypothetical protein ACJMK2_025030 [Sinanodonta woodiana]|uniref:Signal recognition particle 19 kDa protein n=1 Tax=Sinanodonta woodiana TaxID=1069815 RepID=A0ABD3XF78_SINWO
MAQQREVPQQARPWNPTFNHSDRERWICIYPAYINSKRTVKQGRRIPKDKAVENPTYTEMKDICLSAGLQIGVENKTYCKELDPRDMKNRGRIRVQIKTAEGKQLYEKFKSKYDILLYLGEMIPKLKTRQQGQSSGQGGTQQQQQSAKSQKKKGRKGK